jgi:hypothetical protein
LHKNGLTAAIKALVGGSLAVAAAIARKALPNEAIVEQLERELPLARERTDKQSAEDRKAEADRLHGIEAAFRAVRDVMLLGFQRGRTD